MSGSLPELIHALREELKEYGEFLFVLDRQPEPEASRAAEDVFRWFRLLEVQAAATRAAHAQRERMVGRLARELGQPDDTGLETLLPLLLLDYQPLVRALIEENHALRSQVRQRAWQNHRLLSRSLASMRSFLTTCFTGPGELPQLLPVAPATEPLDGR